MIEAKANISQKEILEYLKSIKDELIKEGISEIALFGSFARGDDDIYSDIDIAIRIKEDYLKDYDSWDYFDLIKKIKNLVIQRFGIGCDVFDLDSSSFIKDSVLKELLYV